MVERSDSAIGVLGTQTTEVYAFIIVGSPLVERSTVLARHARITRNVPDDLVAVNERALFTKKYLPEQIVSLVRMIDCERVGHTHVTWHVAKILITRFIQADPNQLEFWVFPPRMFVVSANIDPNDDLIADLILHS